MFRRVRRFNNLLFIARIFSTKTILQKKVKNLIKSLYSRRAIQTMLSFSHNAKVDGKFFTCEASYTTFVFCYVALLSLPPIRYRTDLLLTAKRRTKSVFLASVDKSWLLWARDGQDRRELIKENITRSNPFSALVHGTHRSTHDNWLLVFITSDNVDNRFFAVIFADFESFSRFVPTFF